MKLEAYIRAEGMNYTTFATAIGASPEAVRLWCLGVRTPRWKAIQAIRSATSGRVDIQDFEPERIAV